MKRLGLAVLMVVGVMLLGTTPAWAGERIELANVGDEPQATGTVTYRGTQFVGDPWAGWWETYMSISCQKLTPGASYGTPVGTFTADRRGSGKADGWVTLYDTYYRSALVARRNADGNGIVVLADPYLYGW